MNPYPDEALLPSCCYTVHTSSPLLTLSQVAGLLHRKGIPVDTILSQCLSEQHHRLLVVCRVEKDRVAYLGRHLEEVPGVLSVDWLQHRARTRPFGR